MALFAVRGDERVGKTCLVGLDVRTLGLEASRMYSFATRLYNLLMYPCRIRLPRIPPHMVQCSCRSSSALTRLQSLSPPVIKSSIQSTYLPEMYTIISVELMGMPSCPWHSSPYRRVCFHDLLISLLISLIVLQPADSSMMTTTTRHFASNCTMRRTHASSPHCAQR